LANNTRAPKVKKIKLGLGFLYRGLTFEEEEDEVTVEENFQSVFLHGIGTHQKNLSFFLKNFKVFLFHCRVTHQKKS
jgi:hypothetical protein